MKKLSLICLMALVLASFVAGCSKNAADEEGPKPGAVQTKDGKPLPPEAANATKPQNPFEAAGVAAPGGMKKKGGQ